MPAACEHPQEADRIAALERLQILDTAAEQAYDELVELAANLAGTPIALVSLVDRERQWFKAHYGIDATETPRSMAFCAHAILEPEQPLVVPDATADPRFVDNPLVTGEPNIRCYVGIPLHEPSAALPIGTLCVISDQPKELPAATVAHLRVLARQVERLLTVRDHVRREAERSAALETAVSARSRFLATFSHDVRTPLNGIIGASELLREQQLADEAHQLVGTISACGRSLLHLINDVLDLSRIEAGAMELQREPFDLHALIDDLNSVFDERARRKQIGLHVDLDPATPRYVTGDRARVHQILLNLLGNAVKFTDTGAVTLRVAPTEHGLDLTVSDSGRGMSPADLERIFLPFEQAEDTPGDGVGLGLSIVHSLVELMHGTVTVASEVGAGSTFRLYLPLPTASGPADTQAISTTVPASQARVLVVDDDPVNRTVLSRMLQRLVDEVVVVDGGEAALATAERGFDLVFMDCQMPGIDGLETTRRWRQLADPTIAGQTIVALTADATEDTAAACHRAGMNGVLHKPISIAGLRQALAEHAGVGP